MGIDDKGNSSEKENIKLTSVNFLKLKILLAQNREYVI